MELDKAEWKQMMKFSVASSINRLESGVGVGGVPSAEIF